ncbi:hypothetical protein CYLTODRAFT_494702 [Cylindrobasidium torrendii FP15055 ss-10]|uniref:Phosphatidate phosphatase APP1 catalytic domain-containing protein n=1 Tax=Cylindrobasidium torrendii FP15055 ss-10 TaxID=1314674 RepID=A0A0D7AWI5_9AGAR|nr:hypothetical protein CYLTODRAFT_494702 [Cylindrobasidium torrendii FP15055 ss-10]
MHGSLLSLAALGLAASAAPSPRVSRQDDGTTFLLFDAPAVVNQDGTTASVAAFAYTAPINTSALAAVLTATFEKVGIDASDITTPLERTKLFATRGLGEQEVAIDVSGCSQSVTLTTSGEPDYGLAQQTVSLGSCASASEAFEGTAGDAAITFFPSEDAGFGVISDIDDTVKVSNVLDTMKAIKAVLFDDAVPVSGMPELYSSLVESLDDPNFIYITGSPYELYPNLHDFISTSFVDSRGPILTKNLTVTNIAELASQIFDDSDTLNYKVSQIDRVHELYPNKKFLAIGDSTQKDPEVYAKAFNTYGDFIQCIWIRQVEDADNSDERFATAFEGVPETKYRVFTDEDIVNVLPTLDVAGGSC